MSTKEKQSVSSRRDFFKTAGLGVGAAAVATKVGTAKAASADVDGRGGRGYQETVHVKTYYDLARF